MGGLRREERQRLQRSGIATERRIPFAPVPAFQSPDINPNPIRPKHFASRQHRPRSYAQADPMSQPRIVGSSLNSNFGMGYLNLSGTGVPPGSHLLLDEQGDQEDRDGANDGEHDDNTRLVRGEVASLHQVADGGVAAARNKGHIDGGHCSTWASFCGAVSQKARGPLLHMRNRRVGSRLPGSPTWTRQGARQC